MRARLLLASLVTVLAALFLALPSGAATTPCGAPVVSDGTATVTCAYTGDVQTWTVPQGVTSASFDVQGAQGGSGSGNGTAGNGGRAVDTLHVTPGTVVNVFVGGAGDNGGFNGGGIGGVSVGGGASDIRIGGTALSDRVLIAGGGGGGGNAPISSGGGGGGLVGEDGTLSSTTSGAGGNQDGTTGSLLPGSGGSGSGGGGGGGYWGGAASQMGGGGGGGGSGFGSADVTFTTGYRTGDGQVVITYNVNGSANNQEPGNGDNCTGDLNNNSKNWGPSGLPGNACE